MVKSIKCATLEERRVVDDFSDVKKMANGESAFNSKKDRWVGKDTYLNTATNPGPQ